MLPSSHRAVVLLFASLQVPLMGPCPDSSAESKVFGGGTLVLVENGERRLPREGEFELYVFNGNAWFLRVPIEDGKFCFDLPQGTEVYCAGRVVLEGREATCNWGSTSWEDNLDLVIEARFHPPTRLRARIEGTELELGHCTLTGMNSEGLVSLPYEVPLWTEQEREWGWTGERRYEVTVPGCVPASVRCNLSKGGDVWVDLVPLASLSIDSRPLGAQSGRTLLVKGPRNFIAMQRLDDEPREWTFDQLRPGTYRIWVADGRATAEQRVASFRLHGGESKAIRLEPAIDTKR